MLVDELEPKKNEARNAAAPTSAGDRVVAELNQAIAQASSPVLEEQLLCPIVTAERDIDRQMVSAELASAGLDYTQQETTGEREKYWLYIAAPSTTADAQAMVAKLKQKNIDSYIVARGDMKNRISLGLFSSEERARQAQASIAERSNMLVNIYKHYRTVSLHELMLSKPITESAWQAFLLRLDLSKLLIKIEKNPC